ncbi:hypothetical protein AVEN_161258-1 [Araneus ventricosus]|uniref:CIDE-N domain-containing protein n=1 Tax=Araneus ventricosus TaxID=182803 RepID=A0A4Y2K8H6_ARAVE|nr:hypothetical protein AVEN_161258-1 [Araneus ventricosus]
MESRQRPYKVWSCDRQTRKAVMASNLRELRERGASRLGLPGADVKIVLESDGTEVEDDIYFQTIDRDTIFLILCPGERWLPPGVEALRAALSIYANILDPQMGSCVAKTTGSLIRVLLLYYIKYVINGESKHKVNYLNLLSAMRPIPHSIELPVPHPPICVVVKDESEVAMEVESEEQGDSTLETSNFPMNLSIKTRRFKWHYSSFELVQKTSYNFWDLD